MASLEWIGIIALAHRRVTVDDYSNILKQGFDTLYRDGWSSGRLMVLNLHPCLIGQPFRIGVLDDALGHIMRRQGVWAATGSEIIEWYRSHAPQIASGDG